MDPTAGWNSLLIELFWPNCAQMASRRAKSDFGLRGSIDTLGLKQICLIYSETILWKKLNFPKIISREILV